MSYLIFDRRLIILINTDCSSKYIFPTFNMLRYQRRTAYLTVTKEVAVRPVCRIGSDRLSIGFVLLRSFPKVDNISGGFENGRIRIA